jgi:elongation factor P hydroxylase
MSKRFLSWVMVLTIIVGFTQNQITPNNVQASGVSALPTFFSGAVCFTGGQPIFITAADLNGDSRPDLVVANYGSDTVSVFLNNGCGTFAPKVDYATGTSPVSVAAADLNGDSQPDIIVANAGSNTVSVLANNGSGIFSPKVDYPTGTTPHSVAVTDLNGDSYPDLIVANYYSNTVSVLLNNGSGTFSPKMDYPTGTQPKSVTAADFNGDSHPDIIVANDSSGNTVSVLLNNGNGTFAPKVDYATGSYPSSVTAADLNGDSHPDIIVATIGWDTVSVLINNGSGIFAPKVDYPTGSYPCSVAASDLNGDSRPDIIVANQNSHTVSVLINNGNGTFAPRVDYTSGASPSSVTASDLNGDFRPDIIVANYSSNTVNVLLNAAVNLSLSPASSTVNVGNTFELVIQADAGAIGVAGVDTFLNFDATKLAVVDLDSGTAGIQIIPGTVLNTVLTNIADNTLGTITFGAGKLSAPFSTGPFTVATIRFQALAVTAPTSNVTGTLNGANISIKLDVPITFNPVTVNPVYAGQIFSLEIKTGTGAAQEVNGVAAFIDFDPTKLEVVDDDPGTAGLQITPGTSLPTMLDNSADNTAGKINFSAGNLGTPNPTGSFLVATIHFRAKSVTTPTTTPVTFSFSGVRETMVQLGGNGIPGMHTNATIQISPAPPVDISVSLQGGSRSDSGWIIPLSVKFFNPGADVMTATPIYSFNLATAKVGGYATAQCSGVMPGNYDITALSEHTLLNVKRNVAITSPSTPVNLGTLLEGNANNDDRINILDFGILASAYGKGKGQTGYNAMADFDRNEIVNIFDFGLLATNYLKMAPVEIP